MLCGERLKIPAQKHKADHILQRLHLGVTFQPFLAQQDAYPVLRRRWSAPVAIVVNGFLFALIHFIPILIPGLFLVGIVLAWVRERSGSLLPCMLVHALQNTVVLFSIYAVMNGMAG